MFGGNPGNEAAAKAQSSMRLDDFWKLKVRVANIFISFDNLSLPPSFHPPACETVKGAAAETLPTGDQEAAVSMCM